ncbi:pyridoxamine 5'-phosphate oxidase family protein [Aeromicrobium sp. IC_218]|uniref:pyridoxamine 5'-phosphate oxidase family protein n=1 Tax=Aeromicrobium sp. IC_218 TaxID=2545468 RepID=UPI001038AED2|nr:pyridoxamine 5'-phosphate oxidase family protein [Aeromicrobium sp. IC_218]TCJ00029.1 pyridoxamine 5'-phosphate oxidase family protein [Aeromicrobium sp. IC_218]
MSQTGPTVLDHDEALALLGAGVVGRIAFVDHDGTLQLVPVNYRELDGDVFWLTAAGGILARSADADQVAFQVDHHDDTFQSGWSILLRGRAEVVHDEGLAATLADRGLRPWAPGERTTLVRLRAAAMTGRRVRLAPA